MTQEPIARDWSKEEIKAALTKRGLTLKGLTLAHGYRSVDVCAQALQRPYPKAERIIANAIDLHPAIIWPSRYKGKFNGYTKEINVKVLDCQPT